MTEPPSSEPQGSLLQEVVADVRERFENHRIGAESARIAYYLFLSVFPFLLALFAVTGFLGREPAFNWIMQQLLAAVPPQAAAALEDSVRQVTHVRRPGTLSLALLLTVWSASHAVAALSDGLNAAFRVRRRRRWWRKRMVGLAVIAAGCLAVLIGALTVLAGPELGRLLGLPQLGSLVRWPVVIGVVVGMTWLVYYLLPNRDLSHGRWHLLGGATVGTLLWAVFTLLFRLYLSSFGRLDVVYGVLGGVVVLMVWFYFVALSVLLGGEVAAALERLGRARVGAAGRDELPRRRPAVSRP